MKKFMAMIAGFSGVAMCLFLAKDDVEYMLNMLALITVTCGVYIYYKFTEKTL
jgi:hypothetical protein